MFAHAGLLMLNLYKWKNEKLKVENTVYEDALQQAEVMHKNFHTAFKSSVNS